MRARERKIGRQLNRVLRRAFALIQQHGRKRAINRIEHKTMGGNLGLGQGVLELCGVRETRAGVVWRAIKTAGFLIERDRVQIIRDYLQIINRDDGDVQLFSAQLGQANEVVMDANLHAQIGMAGFEGADLTNQRIAGVCHHAVNHTKPNWGVVIIANVAQPICGFINDIQYGVGLTQHRLTLGRQREPLRASFA